MYYIYEVFHKITIDKCDKVIAWLNLVAKIKSERREGTSLKDLRQEHSRKRKQLGPGTKAKINWLCLRNSKRLEHSRGNRSME